MSLSPTPGARSRTRSRRAFVTFAALVVAFAVSLPVAFGGATASTAPITNYAKFVGAKPGKANAKLKPVVIGMVNLQGGQVQVGPLWTPAVETAIKYANAELRGAGGHPIILKKCFIKSTEEEGTKCGQQMANDKRVSVVLWGGVVIGNQSFYSALGKKPVVGGVIVSPIDEQYKQGFGLFGSGTSVLTPYATFAKNTLKAKTAGVVYPTIPGIAENGVAIVNAMKKVGISVKQVAYDPNTTDLVGPITAAGGQSVDVFVLQDVAGGCVNMAKALTQLGLNAKVLTNPLCLDPRVAAGLGGDYPKWTFAIASSLGFDLTDKSVPPFLKVFKKYAKDPKITADPWTPVGFGQTLTLIQWLNKIGYRNISPASIIKQGKLELGPVPLGAPTVKCGKNKSIPAACNDQTQFFDYKGGFKFVRVSGWVKGP
jgi:branched-chain amino acid transport system substrate-binding protein